MTSATSSTFGVSPKPNQITISGAIATIGSVCVDTSTGMSARRSVAEASTSTASVSPTTIASAKPSSVARSVGSVLSQRSPRLSQLTESTRAGAGSTSLPMPLRFDVQLPDREQQRDDQERRQDGERPAARGRAHQLWRGMYAFV